MPFKKILIIGISEAALDSQYWNKIKSLGELVVTVEKDAPSLFNELEETDALLVNFGISVTTEHLEAAPKLKYIGVMATALGKVDVTSATAKGIVVTNLPGYSTESVAEFTFAALLDYMRDLESGKIRGREGNYSEDGLKATEIKGKTFGVIGLGNIGLRVAEIAQAFGAHVVYWSQHQKEQANQTGLQYLDSERLINSSDIISLNLAQTPETELFLNAERIKNLKPGCILINTAPMELIDLDALSNRLAQGDITFILDHSDEMSAQDLQKISTYKNCIIYPPMAYITEEARVAKQELFVKNIEENLP